MMPGSVECFCVSPMPGALRWRLRTASGNFREMCCCGQLPRTQIHLEKTALVMLSLRGAAKELSRQIPPQIIVQGGVINGTQVDPLTYLMHSLQERFGNLGEEVRVQAVTELMTFQRKHHEPIDSLLVRFEAVRSRSAEQGGAIVSIQGISWLLLRAIGITESTAVAATGSLSGIVSSDRARIHPAEDIPPQNGARVRAGPWQYQGRAASTQHDRPVCFSHRRIWGTIFAFHRRLVPTRSLVWLSW